MKTKFKLITVFALMLFVLSINAQEQKKIKIKMIKDVNGKTIVIDTIIIGTDFKDIDLSGFHITSEMEEIIEHLESGEKKESMMKFYFTDNEKSNKGDSLKHVWVEVSDELEGDSNESSHAFFVSRDSHVITDKNMVFVSSNSDGETEIDTIIHNRNKKIIIKKVGEEGEDKDVMVWVSDSDGDTEMNDSVKVIKVKNVITKSGENDEVTVYVTSDGENDKSAKEKSYKVIVKSGENGEYKTVVMDGKEGELNSDEDVIILKSFEDTHNSMIIIKGINDEDKKILSEIKKDIKPENELNEIDLQIKFKVQDKKVSLEFDVKNKSNIKINIFDKTGKSSFSDEQKGFSGIYNKEFDLNAGEYFIQISQGKKTATKKLIIK